jgi:DEAD/DEAH box helicase domain-containing protein
MVNMAMPPQKPQTHRVQATLGVGKMSDGLQAVEWYRTGQLDKLEEYCRKDVDLTRQLYDFGKQNGKIYFLSKRSGRRREVPAYW